MFGPFLLYSAVLTTLKPLLAHFSCKAFLRLAWVLQVAKGSIFLDDEHKSLRSVRLVHPYMILPCFTLTTN